MRHDALPDFCDMNRKDTMATKTPRKPRTKKPPKLTVEHAIFGPGLLVERRATQSGSEIVTVEFADKTTRSLLNNSDHSSAIPAVVLPRVSVG
jgi:hypothetical protein